MQDLPKCADCGTLLFLRSRDKSGYGRYQCVKCKKWSSEYEPVRRALEKERKQRRLQERARRAESLAEFLKTLYPENDTSQVENYVRRSVAAKKLGVSRQRIHQKIEAKQLKVLNVAGIDWVEVG